MADEPLIRNYRPEDRQAVRDIFYETAFLGEPASAFFDGRELISDALTLYFTDHEPGSCFVAESKGEVVGCIIGAKNKAVFDDVSGRLIFPALLRKAFFEGIFLKPKNVKFLYRIILSAFKREFSESDLSKQYPAILHVNLRPGYRGHGTGSALIRAFCDHLVKNNVPGVHLATMSDKAAKFFSAQGFELLHKGKRSYFRNILGQDTPLYIYGKMLIKHEPGARINQFP